MCKGLIIKFKENMKKIILILVVLLLSLITFSQTKLHDHIDRLVLNPIWLGRYHARPRPAAAPVNLAALHRIIDGVAAGIAGDIANLRA